MMMKEKEFLGRDLFQRGKEIAATQEHLGQEYLCEDGKSQIDIFLSDKSELFNPLTVGQQRDLSPSVYQLIDEKMYTISLKDPVRLCFLGKIPDIQEQEAVKEMLQRHYMYLVHDKTEDLRINRLKTICLALFGTLLLAIYFAIEMTASRPVFVEVVSIAGCFSIWEAVDTWLLERKKLKVDYLCAVQAVLCEVVFTGNIDN